MGNSNKEIEIRILLENSEIFENWLNTNAKYMATKKQEDIYFEPPDHSFLKKDKNCMDGDEWLRIRESNGTIDICYKKWHRDPVTNASLFADEFETSVGNKMNILKIFECLGFTRILSIKKIRNSWVYKHFKIEKDTIENLGVFYEIELDADREENINAIFNFLNEIGLNHYQIIDRGYPWMLLNKNWRDHVVNSDNFYVHS